MLKPITEFTREELLEQVRIEMLRACVAPKDTPAECIRFDAETGEVRVTIQANR